MVGSASVSPAPIFPTSLVSETLLVCPGELAVTIKLLETKPESTSACVIV